MFTPGPSLKRNRQAQMNVSSYESPSGVITPIRRVSMITSTPADALFQANDDEAERRRLKRMSTVTAVQERERVRPSIPFDTLQEYIGNCVRMASENKINSKNVWKIHIIDYLKTLLERQVENPLQIASATLGASAKVYGLRVDDAYAEVLKLAGELGRRNPDEANNDDNDPGPDENNENETPEEAAKRLAAKRKKKRKSKKLLHAPDTLVGEPELFEIDHPLIAELNSRGGDILGIDNMFQIFVPIKNLSNEYDIREDESFFDFDPPKAHRIDNSGNEDAMELDVKLMKLPLELFPINKISSLSICPEKFSLMNWSLDDEGEQNATIKPLTSEEINLAFDMDAEPLPILDQSLSQHLPDQNNYSSDEEIVTEEVNAEHQERGTTRPHIETVADMVPTNPNTTRNLEYSYNTKYANDIWAGPAYWKLKSIAFKIPPRINGQSGNILQKPVAKKKGRVSKSNTVDISYEESQTHEISINNRSFNSLKLATVTSWNINSKKNVYPADLHINVVERMCLILNKSYKIYPVERPGSNLSIHNKEYDYDNLNDSTYCTPNAEPLEELHSVSDHEHMDNDDIAPEENMGEICQIGDEMFIGANMVEAPRVIPKTFVPYATRAKKVDMKRIKCAMWGIITLDKTISKDQPIPEKMVIPDNFPDTKFSELCKSLPSNLPSDQAKNLSPALVFFGLLHLANENTLELIGQQDLRDLTIKKG